MIENVSREELEAAADLYDHVIDGTHEQRQAEAVAWIVWFNRLSQPDKMLAATNQLTPETQRLRDTSPITNRIQ